MRLLIAGAMALALVACSSGAPPAAKGRASAKSDVASQVAAVRAAGVNGNELEVQPLRDPQVEDLRLQAEAQEARREIKQANATLDRALALTPGDPDLLQWKAEWIDSLGRAALLMNVSMLRLQDQLANDERPLTDETRAEIQAHAERSAGLLRDSEFADTLCVEVVRLHHDGGRAELPLAELNPAQQLARLLRRVDVFAAQISLRASRPPVSPVTAAREACLAAAGLPDEIGGALLRAVGLFPPGSFVELASGEIGIVVARGRRANLPQVAALLSHSGNLIAEPLLRDTMDRRYAAKSAVAPDRVRVIPPHERLLALR